MRAMAIAKRYTLFPLAKTDLENIWLYTLDTWSRAQADSYVDALFDSFDDILSGKAQSKNVSDIREGYFRVAVRSHFVFYKLVSDEVQIVRILHQRMNTEAHL